jgi:hypothetical protein
MGKNASRGHEQTTVDMALFSLDTSSRLEKDAEVAGRADD